MKNILPLLFACSLSICPLAFAAPETSASFSSNPFIEPAAVALLDKSAKAYAAMNGVSMEFLTTENLLSTPMINRVAFLRPDKAKVEVHLVRVMHRSVASGGQLSQSYVGVTTRTQYPKQKPAVQAALEHLNLIHSIPLYFLLDGKNPATATEPNSNRPAIGCESASLLPDNGVLLRLREAETRHPPFYLRLYFGKNDSLLRRVEADMVTNGKRELVHVTKLTRIQVNPKFSLDSFKLATG